MKKTLISIMRSTSKLIALFFMFNSLVGFGQSKIVYTIGSPNSIGTCYPATPAAIRVGASTTTHVFTNASALNTAITDAYNAGFRHFYFQEGLYNLTDSINLDNKHGIVIEGAGKGTVFKANSTTLNSIFVVKNCSNGVIKNLSIDLKTTVLCTDGQNPSDIQTGIKIGTQTGRCLFENIYLGSSLSSNATVGGLSPILVQLSNGQESDYNTFNNIHFQRSLGGIVLDITGSSNQNDKPTNGVFNHNTFSNIHFDLCTIAVDFRNSGGIIEGNLFSNFDIQADNRTAPVANELRRRTIDVVRNIRGTNNTFQNFNIGDYNACVTIDTPNGCPRKGYVFSITSGAERTVIENCEVDGNFVTGGSEKNGWYLNNGIGTQFINNASTNRLTDYIKHNLNDVIFVGQNSPNPVRDTGIDSNFNPAQPNSANLNYFNVDNFGSVTFNGRTQNLKKTNGVITQNTYLNSIFYAENYGSYSFGNPKGNVGSPNTNIFSGTDGSLFTIKGQARYQPHSGGLWNHQHPDYPGVGTYYFPPDLTPDPIVGVPTPLCVITNRDHNGTFQWTKVSDILSASSWNHIAARNINMNGLAITNTDNTTATATNPSNVVPGIRLDTSGNVRIGTVAPAPYTGYTDGPKLKVDGDLEARQGIFTTTGLPDGTIFSNGSTRNDSCVVLSAGSNIGTGSAYKRTRMLNYFDFPASNIDPKSSFHFGLEDRNDFGRFRLAAQTGGWTLFNVLNKSQQDLFRVYEDGNDNVSLTMPKVNSSLAIGTATPLAQLHTTGSVRFAGITNANHNRIMTQDVDGNVFWRDASTLGSANISANQGVTMSGNQVRLGDACGGSGAPFTQNREVNLSNFNLYFNSKSPQSGTISDGKIYMGTNACQTLQSRLEISTAGQSNSPKNDYSSPNPSTSGLRFKDLTAISPTIKNESSGVLSLDKEGDVIWVNRDLNNSNTMNTCNSLNLVPKLTGTNTYGCSQIFDNGTSVGVSTTGPFTYTTTGAAWTSGSPAASGTAKFSVNGLGRFTSLVVTSDMTLKKDIEAIENPNAIIEKLEGKTYAWKDEVVKEALIDNGRHYGFLAQEVEKVMPEAVIKDEKGRYAVEYNAFIPVLVESQKILIKENTDLKSELNDLKTELKELKALILNSQSDLKNESSVAILYQNVPNPFSNTTTIKYFVPNCVGECKIIISDLTGKLVYTHAIEKSGEGSFQFDASRLYSTGNLLYSLVVNGKIVANKKMLFTTAP